MEDHRDEERREEARASIALDVFCSAGREEGTAKLFDVSPLGARLDSATIRPAVGAPVKIVLQTAGDEESQVLNAIVVRHTPSGFAVEFRVFNPLVLQIVEKYGSGSGNT